jgi:hypothetical protein
VNTEEKRVEENRGSFSAYLAGASTTTFLQISRNRKRIDNFCLLSKFSFVRCSCSYEQTTCIVVRTAEWFPQEQILDRLFLNVLFSTTK